MQYTKNKELLNDRDVWVVQIENKFDAQETLLLSKVSEAICPNKEGNHIGPGATLNQFIECQKGVRFIINGGFNHYRKDFYDWPHQNFEIGDPVGWVKIRDNLYKDFVRLDLYGFFVQKEKFAPWDILRKEDITEQEKYILGCTPMLLFDSKPVPLPAADLVPVKGINPPSVLGHGLQNHSRTAVGLKNNQIYFILVEEDLVHGGCNLFDLQKIGLKLGLEKMLNLDGGGSSQLKIFENNSWTESYVAPEDKDRILGNVIVLFDERLK